MIKLEQLTKAYGDRNVVDQVSLTVKRSELVVLLGTSGCGKTTTLKMINRLIEPTAGSVCIDGVDTSHFERHELRRKIGYVFQQVGLFPHMTITENVGVTLSLLGWSDTRIHKRVAEVLELVELDPEVMRNRYPTTLSGGEQQRVGFARALAAEPSLMLLDEPFGALDPITRDRLQISFSRIKQQLSLTAIFVTHDFTEALVLADRIVVMREGCIVQIGTPRDLITKPIDGFVKRMVSTPIRQAKIVEALLASGGAV